jgi:hypothetical protein
VAEYPCDPRPQAIYANVAESLERQPAANSTAFEGTTNRIAYSARIKRSMNGTLLMQSRIARARLPAFRKPINGY